MKRGKERRREGEQKEKSFFVFSGFFTFFFVNFFPHFISSFSSSSFSLQRTKKQCVPGVGFEPTRHTTDDSLKMSK